MAHKKEKKVRVKIKVLPIFITFFIILVLIGSYFLLTNISITNIYIKGNNYLNDQTIIEDAGIEDYPSFIKITKSKIIRKLKKNPYIKSVSVNKKLFGTIEIKVTEYNILFRKEESGMLVLENGKEVNDNNKYIVPILLNYVPDTKYSTFIRKMNDVSENIKTQISEIRYYPNNQDEDRFLLYMSDGNSVYLTLTKFKQINYYEDVLDQLDGKKGILYLDSGNHFKVME